MSKKKNRIDRRHALRLFGAGASAAGLSSVRVLAWGQQGQQGPGGQLPYHEIPVPVPPKKLLLVFLRGGYDGLNVMCSSGAAAQTMANTSYATYKTLRPNIHLFASNDPAGPTPVTYRARPLVGPTSTDPFAELNPALQEMLPVYQAGDLALMHRIGYQNSSLSHFSGQQFWETGRPSELFYLEGWVTKWAAMQPQNFISASVSASPQRLFNSDVDANVQPHIRRLQAQSSGQTGYTFHDVPAASTPFETDLVAGLQAQSQLPGGGGPPSIGFWDERSRTILEKAIASEGSVANLVANGYTPQAGANYPQSDGSGSDPWSVPAGGFVTAFGDELKDAAAILKNTSAKIVGVEIGGWDTHNNQVNPGDPTHAFGQQQQRLATLGAGLRAIYEDFTRDGTAPNLLTLCMSEFGRTSPENTSLGTDHALGGLMFAMGKTVRSAQQVHNFGAANFNTPNFTDGGPKFMLPQTDYRAVLEEALQNHLGFTGNIDTIFKNYSVDKAGGPAAFFQQLNYI